MTNEEITKIVREAMECHGKKDYPRELELWQTVLKERPDHPLWRHNVAFALMNNGHLIEALDIFDDLVTRHPDLSRVHNNRAVLLLRLGAELQDLVPAFLIALATSKDLDEFTRHLHNACVSIAYGSDRGSSASFDILEKEFPKALARVSPKEYLEKNILTLTRMIAAFRRIGAYREAFAHKRWDEAEEELESAKSILKEIGIQENNLDTCVECLHLCRDTIGTLERLSVDQTLKPDVLFKKFQSLFEKIHALREADPSNVMNRFMDILGWFLVGCAEAFNYLSGTGLKYNANDEPQIQIRSLASGSFTDIGQDLASFVQFVHKQCLQFEKKTTTIASRDQINELREVVLRKIALFSSGLHFDFSNLDIALANQMLGWSSDAIDEMNREVQKFKLFVERQAYKDVFVNGKPQENIARALLQAFLVPRSYREVKVRAGKSDLLLFSKSGKFLFETKIWRGIEYHNQGLRELEEYIIGEGDDPELRGVFYVVFDPTKSASAPKEIGGVMTEIAIVNRRVNLIVVNLAPPEPSKKLEGTD